MTSYASRDRWVAPIEADDYPYGLLITVGGDIPNPLNGNFEELNVWVKENLTNGFRYKWDRVAEMGGADTLNIQFEDKNEALMFKLRWGGA